MARPTQAMTKVMTAMWWRWLTALASPSSPLASSDMAVAAIRFTHTLTHHTHALSLTHCECVCVPLALSLTRWGSRLLESSSCGGDGGALSGLPHTAPVRVD
jgi:hypothetical protein